MTFPDFSNIETEPFLIEKDINGEFDRDGYLIVTGTMYQPEIWKERQVRSVIKPELGDNYGGYFYTNLRKLHWIDVLAFSTAIKYKEVNPFRGRLEYKIGRHWRDKLGLYLLAQKIVQGEGKVGWKELMDYININNPIHPEYEQENSPFNPKSPYYETRDLVMFYDEINLIIIYKSGEIFWTQTGKRYYDQANGMPSRYNKDSQQLTFSTKAVLDLKTLTLTKPDGAVTVVNNELPWYEKLVKNLLSDTKTQLILLGTLFLLIIFKAKRKRRYEK